jgi:SEC-C motif-containing protein
MPHHRGGEPGDPAALVRSRFAAFAVGDGAYLWRTLHPDHALRAQPERAVVRELGRAHRTQRYRSVHIHDVEVDGDRARVLFTARVFEKGRDRSFVEASRFERTDEGWRYLDGLPFAPDEHAERTLAELDAGLTSTQG